MRRLILDATRQLASLLRRESTVRTDSLVEAVAAERDVVFDSAAELWRTGEKPVPVAVVFTEDGTLSWQRAGRTQAAVSVTLDSVPLELERCRVLPWGIGFAVGDDRWLTVRASDGLWGILSRFAIRRDEPSAVHRGLSLLAACRRGEDTWSALGEGLQVVRQPYRALAARLMATDEGPLRIQLLDTNGRERAHLAIGAAHELHVETQSVPTSGRVLGRYPTVPPPWLLVRGPCRLGGRDFHRLALPLLDSDFVARLERLAAARDVRTFVETSEE